MEIINNKMNFKISLCKPIQDNINGNNGAVKKTKNKGLITSLI